MQNKPAIYLGRIVDKKHFRVFVYGAFGQRRLVESWDEFEEAMQSGLWFAEDSSIPKKANVKKVKAIEVKPQISDPEPDSMLIEIV